MSYANQKWMTRLALESVGSLAKEIEHEFYAQLTDTAQLERADSVEHQSQWEIRTPNDDGRLYVGSVRVRKTVKDGQASYMFCIKTMIPGQGTRNETELEVTEDIYEQFRRVAQKGMVKTRYSFKVPDSDYVWEIDLFDNNRDEAQPWVKIDLEVSSKAEELPKFPLSVVEIIGTKNRTAEQQQKIDELFETVFISRPF